MSFFTEYFRLIDLIALIALVALAVTAFIQKRSIWMGLLAIVVVVWAVTRFLSPFDPF